MNGLGKDMEGKMKNTGVSKQTGKTRSFIGRAICDEAAKVGIEI